LAEIAERKHPTRRKRFLLALAAALLVLAAFYLFVTLRGPRQYMGELAQLLPARTSCYIALSDFDGMRRRIGQTPLYDALSKSVDLAALLMTNEQWRRYQENKGSVEWKAKAALARRFIKRYFSRRVALALSRLDGCDEPALLVMAETDLGFTEKLAELCAELYPDLHLTCEKYRGIPIYAYEGEKSKRSFTFVRFGKTVVISLRSNERNFLRRIIDYRLDRPAETLFATRDFRRAWKSPARRQGVLAVARPAPLLADLQGRPDFRLKKYLAAEYLALLRRDLEPFRFAEAGLAVGRTIDLRLRLRPSDSTARPPRGEQKVLELLDTVSSGCLAFADFRFKRLDETLARILNIHRAFGREAADPEALARAVEKLNSQWDLDIERDLAPALGKEAAVVVYDLQLPAIFSASIVIPAADHDRAAEAIKRLSTHFASYYADPSRSWIVPESFGEVPDFQPLYSTPLGFLAVSCLGDHCVWGVGASGCKAAARMLEGRGEPITANPVFRSLDLPTGEPLEAVGFINLEEIGRRAEAILPVLALVSKSVRKRSAKYAKIIAVVKLLRGAGFYARHKDGDLEFVLKVPTR